MKTNKEKPRLRPISAEHFEREVSALTRLHAAGVLTAKQHKAKYDVLVRRIRLVGDE